MINFEAHLVHLHGRNCDSAPAKTHHENFNSKNIRLQIECIWNRSEIHICSICAFLIGLYMTYCFRRILMEFRWAIFAGADHKIIIRSTQLARTCSLSIIFYIYMGRGTLWIFKGRASSITHHFLKWFIFVRNYCLKVLIPWWLHINNL